MGEDQDNGFVERPTRVLGGRGARPGSNRDRLIKTAENGKSVKFRYDPSGLQPCLRKDGYVLHRAKRNGVWLAWCERIEPSSRPEGA